MKTTNHPSTFINLNGNSRKDLAEQYGNIKSAHTELVNAFANADFFHGRNSKNADHLKELQAKQKELWALLNKFEEGVDSVTRDL